MGFILKAINIFLCYKHIQKNEQSESKALDNLQQKKGHTFYKKTLGISTIFYNILNR